MTIPDMRKSTKRRKKRWFRNPTAGVSQRNNRRAKETYHSSISKGNDWRRMSAGIDNGELD